MEQFTLDTPFEEILDPGKWTANSLGVETERNQALVTAKLAKILQHAEQTADTFNRRILRLTWIMALVGLAQLLVAAVQCWPIVAGWIKK